MKEYVLREDVLRCVEEAGHDNELDLGYPDHNEAFQEIIKDIPAADVVEVVRCKGCRYFYNGSMKCCTNHAGVVLTDENGFCHHAKRIEDEGGNA